jgi:cation-transporting ATPase E
MYLTGLVGVALIARISIPLNALRSALLVSVVAMLLGGSILFQDFFKLAPMSGHMFMFLGVVGVLALGVFELLYRHFNGDEGKKDPVMGLVERLGGRA